jgi:cob(I)alamin adenosyltransferase
MKETLRVYTKAGDQGTTSLGTGEVLCKNDKRLIFIGTIDELNSLLGIVRAYCPNEKILFDTLETLQNHLMEIGADMAFCHQKKANITQSHVHFLEKTIDDVTSHLSPLKNLILPGGSIVAAHLHFARSVARRAERSCCDLIDFYKEHSKRPQSLKYILIYLNRLSDLLFILARYANDLGKADILWNIAKSD